jgi:site-specific DNA-cytosine methylase
MSCLLLGRLQNMFGGIGSAIVALKRLSIAIGTIVHVEHDKVATHVYRWNHDEQYATHTSDRRSNRTTVSDGIQHIYYESFEDFVRHLKKKEFQIGTSSRYAPSVYTLPILSYLNL